MERCVLSIDVGLRNLAFCCMTSNNCGDTTTYKINLWNVYNTLDSDDYTCNSIQKSGKVCGKKCSFKYVSEETNEPKGSEEIELKGSDTEPKIVIYSCKTHFPKKFNCKLKEHNFKKKSIDDYLLQDIAKCVLCKIQEIYDNFLFELNLTNIFIELQPKINRKAVFTSHIIYGKLVEMYSNTNIPIRFVRASQKLKAYIGPTIECKLKGAYAKRKWLSIQYTKWFLENKFSEEQRSMWLPFFENLKGKKDDASDTFLMAINALYGIPKKQKFQKNGKCIK
jgi:hypothetical protein